MRAAFVALFLLPSALSAQGLIVPRCPRPMPAPEPDCRPMPIQQQIVRTHSDIRVELRDRMLRYEVEERFVNRGGTVGEADYVFPLPKNAAFRDLKLSIDGQMVAGETMNATDARRIYEDIVRRQRDPALVEWMGHGMLRARIFPIQPGEERRVVVRYESVAEREGDAVRVDYFIGTRLPGARVSSVDGARPVERESRTSFALTYRAGGELGEPYSPTHELDVERDGVRRDVRIRGGGPDITVLVTLRRSREASVSMLAHAARREQGYALFTVTPPSELASSRMPRDITFVIDVSGSMSGRKLEQAKAAGHQLLATLTPQDRFRLIDFSSDVRSFRDELAFATEANLRAARRYLDALEATGSTNISGALDAALRPDGRAGRGGGNSGDGEQGEHGGRGAVPAPRFSAVLFLTDGAPTAGERDPAAIAARAARIRGDTRVFTFGVGADLNVGLIEQLALEARGTAHFVRPDENVERAVELVATRLRQPLLTDVRVSVEGGGGNVRLSRLYPAGEQDIFAGQDLVLLARYEGSGPARVQVRGRSGGSEVRWTSERHFPREERENAFVPRLWATQRIGWLSAEKRRNGGSREIDDEIRQLGEQFGIPTEFTSYLVLEPGMVAGMGAGSRQSANRVDSSRARIRGIPISGTSGGAAGMSPAAAPMVAQFESAREAAAQRTAKSLAAADQAVSANPDATRRAGQRVFVLDAGRWVDARFKPELRVYKVKAYSPEYFTLIERLPELREAFAVGDRVLVAGRTVAVEVADDAAQLGDRDIQAIVREFQLP